MDYPLYHYGLEDLNDTGFGCSYRNIQTFLSCYSRYYDNECIVPNIRDILYYFEKEYMKYIEQYRTRSLWIEPLQVSEYLENFSYTDMKNITQKLPVRFKNILYCLKDSDGSKMLKTDLNHYISNNSIYNKDNVTNILDMFVEHFKNSRLPIIIDDGVFSYCIADVTGSTVLDNHTQSFGETSDPLSITVLDPHTQKAGGKIYKKNIYWFINSFWMIAIPCLNR